MPNYIAGNGITIENNIISSKTTSTSEIGSFKVDGSTIYIDNNNVIHGKKEQKITLSDITLEINAETTTVTVTEHIGDGALSVSSSDTDVVTASISGDTITIIGVDSGEATITVTASATSTYQEATATIAVTVQAVDTRIFGVYWDGSSSPQMTRTDDAVGFTDPNPYYAGMSGTPSSPFDDIMPWAGMRIVEDASAGTLVEIPKFWYKWTLTDDAIKLQITADSATATANNFYCSPAHSDRSDGVGERDYVYVGRYHCASDYKSKTGVTPVGNISKPNFYNYIHNLGTTIWQQDYLIFWTIRMLYLVEFAHWNSQLKIGYGCGDNVTIDNMGYTDLMPYHTGTTQSSRTTYGLGTQYRYIEGLWDNVYDFVDGLYISGSRYSSSFYGVITKNPADYLTQYSPSTHTQIGVINGSGWILSWTARQPSGHGYALVPNRVTANTGYDVLYVCDKVSISNTTATLFSGGSRYNTQEFGLFYLNASENVNYQLASIGSRLMVLPPSRLTS